MVKKILGENEMEEVALRGLPSYHTISGGGDVISYCLACKDQFNKYVTEYDTSLYLCRYKGSQYWLCAIHLSAHLLDVKTHDKILKLKSDLNIEKTVERVKKENSDLKH